MRNKTGYDDYEWHFTDGEKIDTPDDVLDEVSYEMEKSTKKILKSMVRFFKKMGWRVSIDEYDQGFEIERDDVYTIIYSIVLSVKGGQKLVLDRKQWVSDGRYSPEIILAFHSDDGAEAEEDPEGIEEQIDVDDFKTHPAWYIRPSSEFDEFGIVDGEASRKLYSETFSAREVEKFCREWSTWYLSENSRSKWKKRRANHYTKEDEYGIEETHLVWSKGSSGVPAKYSDLYKSLGDFGKYILARKRTGLATTNPSQFSISCVFNERANDRGMEINIENVVIDTTYSHSKTQQRVESIVREELRGLRIKNVMFRRKSLRIIAEMPTFKQSSLVQRVASRHQKVSMEKIDGNFKRVSPLIGTWFEGLISKLNSIEIALGYAEQIATKEHKRLEQLLKKKYGYSDNFQDDDYDDPLVQAFIWIDEFWGQVWTGKTRSMNVFQRKVEEAKDALRSTIYEINSWGDIERRMASQFVKPNMYADFVNSIEYAVFRKDPSFLRSFISQVRSLEDKEFVQAIIGLCNRLIGTLQYLKELEDLSQRKRAMVERVSVQKIARDNMYADFVRSVNFAFKFRESESMLSSIQRQALSLEDKEFGKEISAMCKMLIGRLKYIEGLRRDSTGWGAFDSKSDWD